MRVLQSRWTSLPKETASQGQQLSLVNCRRCTETISRRLSRKTSWLLPPRGLRRAVRPTLLIDEHLPCVLQESSASCQGGEVGAQRHLRSADFHRPSPLTMQEGAAATTVAQEVRSSAVEETLPRLLTADPAVSSVDNVTAGAELGEAADDTARQAVCIVCCCMWRPSLLVPASRAL